MNNTFPGGYHGKLLRVDLSAGSTRDEALDELFCRRYLGGAGFLAYYLWKELEKRIDPLGPGNKLIFAQGPVSGMQLPGAARNCVGAKSPLTGGVAKSEVGGYWPADFKRCGYDAIIIEGRAEKPVYLWIRDGRAEIRDAGNLWGKETRETEAAIREELGDDRIQLAMIGPAGENLVLFSCIMSGLFDAAGRGGLGAVMGSKKLKAVAVRGHHLPRIANGERIKEIRRDMIARKSPMSEFGTGGPEMNMGEKEGNLPVRNFRDGEFPAVEKINGIAIRDTIRVRMDGCYACPVRCKKVVEFKEPYVVDQAYGGPEYETLASLGSDCGVEDIKAIARGNEMCNAYSLDTISTGSTIAFAMECFENGLLSKEDTGGIDLRFGNAEAMLQCIELIARQEGFGKMLAEGTKRMVKKLGPKAAKYAMQVKGLEAGMHDPRTKTGMGLGFMLNPHGADHVCGIMDGFYAQKPMLKPVEPMGVLEPVDVMDIGPHKVDIFKMSHCKSVVDDSLVVCVFLGYSYQLAADVVSAITGWNVGPNELLTVGERILTLFRLFNLREGFTRADDKLPERFFQPKTDGALADKTFDPEAFERAVDFYFALMGWDSNGVPLPDKVEALYIEQPG
jgi:aldehyde:ferredoxin oxidoreductase